MESKHSSWTSPRNVAIASVTCVVIGAIACGSEPTEVAIAPMAAPGVVVSAPGVATAPGVAVAPAHGGTVVLAGEHPVEVVPHADGHVYAYVLGDEPPPPRGTEIEVVVPISGGVRTVELAWDGRERRWAGRVRRVEIVPGPIEVVLVVGDSRWVGYGPTIVVLPAIVVAPSVVVVERGRGKHRKHRKHRGRRGRDLEIRWGH